MWLGTPSSHPWRVDVHQRARVQALVLLAHVQGADLQAGVPGQDALVPDRDVRLTAGEDPVDSASRMITVYSRSISTVRARSWVRSARSILAREGAEHGASDHHHEPRPAPGTDPGRSRGAVKTGHSARARQVEDHPSHERACEHGRDARRLEQVARYRRPAVDRERDLDHHPRERSCGEQRDDA